MHFIITGGAGFIGSHVTEQLLMEGHRLTVVDNLSTGFRNYLPEHDNLKVICKDISHCRPQDFVGPIDGLAHLAATASVQQSWSQPLETHNNNLSATIAAIQLCGTLEIPRLVFTSSAAVYGNPLELPLTEKHPTNPISPYGLDKLMGEKYIYLFTKKYRFSAVILRLFNVFGERQSPQSDYSGVISIFTSAMQRGLPITLYGDGQQTRDFVYVKDVTNAFVQALTVPLKENDYVDCNIGSGQRTSLLKVLAILKEYYPNWQAPIKFTTPRSGDIQDSWANIDKAKEILQFSPKLEISNNLERYLSSIKT